MIKCLRNCNFVFAKDLLFWRVIDVMKVHEKFRLYGKGLFLLEDFIIVMVGKVLLFYGIITDNPPMV